MPCEHRRETQARIAALTTAAPAAVAGPSADGLLGEIEDWLNDLRQANFSGYVPQNVFSEAGDFVDRIEQLRDPSAPTTQPAPQQEPTSVDLKTMELAESVGLIGPASRAHDLHAAIQRFHDLICANATINAAQMAAEAISEAVPQPSPASQGDALSQAARDVLAERQRQISTEGWTPEHDDEHGDGGLAKAAACYALHTEPFGNVGDYLRFWPWAAEWWKPKDRRRNLTKAGALILAELERIDRADAARAAQGEAE